MANLTTSSDIDTFMGSANNAAARTNLGVLPLAGGTLTGQLIQSTNGAASASPLLVTGTVFTGGSSTTTKPAFLVEPTGTTSTGWNTNGSLLGLNAPSGFSGLLVDAKVNGVARLSLSSSGDLVATGFLWAATYLRAGNLYFNNIANTAEFYHDSAAILIGAGVSTADLRRGGAYCLQLGTDGALVSNQHFKACNRITSDGVGANLTISGGNGRGGAGGDLILASYTTAGSGVAGTLTTRWRIDAATGKLLPEANATYDLGSDTLNLSSVWSSAFYVGVNQVVGAQGAAVGDAATGAATASFGDVNTALDGIATQLNTLLARVRIHGLIAT